jgi:hypothetical protein
MAVHPAAVLELEFQDKDPKFLVILLHSELELSAYWTKRQKPGYSASRTPCHCWMLTMACGSMEVVVILG